VDFFPNRLGANLIIYPSLPTLKSLPLEDSLQGIIPYYFASSSGALPLTTPTMVVRISTVCIFAENLLQWGFVSSQAISQQSYAFTLRPNVKSNNSYILLNLQLTKDGSFWMAYAKGLLAHIILYHSSPPFRSILGILSVLWYQSHIHSMILRAINLF